MAAMATADDNNTPAIAALPNVLDNPFSMVLTFLMCMSVHGADVAAPSGASFVVMKRGVAEFGP
jgi:hypothetical protein